MSQEKWKSERSGCRGCGWPCVRFSKSRLLNSGELEIRVGESVSGPCFPRLPQGAGKSLCKAERLCEKTGQERTGEQDARDAVSTGGGSSTDCTGQGARIIGSQEDGRLSLDSSDTVGSSTSNAVESRSKEAGSQRKRGTDQRQAATREIFAICANSLRAEWCHRVLLPTHSRIFLPDDRGWERAFFRSHSESSGPISLQLPIELCRWFGLAPAAGYSG